MSLVVYLALLASAVVVMRHGPARALLAVYLPTLLLLPDGLRAITPGLPDPNFNQAAIIPIIAMAVLRYGSRWQPAPMDFLIVLFGVCVGLSDYLGRGYADAQNLMFAMLFSVMAPYFAARLMIGADNLHVAVGRRFVALVFVVAVIGFFEFRFGYNPFHATVGKLFGGQGSGWVTTFRHGVARVAGPYSHAILAGIMLVTAYRLQRWLQWGGHWETRFALLPALPWSKAAIITGMLALGTVMTVARGPWLGGLVAVAIVAVGRARNRGRALAISAGVLAVGTVAGAAAMASYLDIQPGQMMTMSQESALYRKVLFEKYLAIVLEQPWFGWGLTTWPKVPGMESIDNYYLLISLMHGLPAMFMLVVMLLGSALMCIRRGLQEPVGSNSPLFTFAGIFVAIFVALGTVYLGEQVLPTLFFVLGWSQAALKTPGALALQPAQAHTPAQPAARTPFRGLIR
jgi:O-antigen ligase